MDRSGLIFEYQVRKYDAFFRIFISDKRSLFKKRLLFMQMQTRRRASTQSSSEASQNLRAFELSDLPLKIQKNVLAMKLDNPIIIQYICIT